jgi:hypothetical protein
VREGAWQPTSALRSRRTGKPFEKVAKAFPAKFVFQQRAIQHPPEERSRPIHGPAPKLEQDVSRTLRPGSFFLRLTGPSLGFGQAIQLPAGKRRRLSVNCLSFLADDARPPVRAGTGRRYIRFKVFLVRQEMRHQSQRLDFSADPLDRPFFLFQHLIDVSHITLLKERSRTVCYLSVVELEIRQLLGPPKV